MSPAAVAEAVAEVVAGSFAPDTIAVSAPAAIAPLSVAAASQPIEPIAATPSMVVPIVILRRRRLARDRASVRPLSLVFMGDPAAAILSGS